jgi:hypothetical protein
MLRQVRKCFGVTSEQKCAKPNYYKYYRKLRFRALCVFQRGRDCISSPHSQCLESQSPYIMSVFELLV